MTTTVFNKLPGAAGPRKVVVIHLEGEAPFFCTLSKCNADHRVVVEREFAPGQERVDTLQKSVASTAGKAQTAGNEAMFFVTC